MSGDEVDVVGECGAGSVEGSALEGGCYPDVWYYRRHLIVLACLCYVFPALYNSRFLSLLFGFWLVRMRMLMQYMWCWVDGNITENHGVFRLGFLYFFFPFCFTYCACLVYLLFLITLLAVMVS